jgi:hypothetical protein
MLAWLQSWLQRLPLRLLHMLTGQDNTTIDIGRVSWALSFVAVVAAAGANWWHGAVIGLRELAESLGIVATTHGVALLAKARTEPPAKDSP